MLIRTRRRRRIRRSKRPIPNNTMGTINTSHVASPTNVLPTSPNPCAIQSSDDSTDLYYRAYANHHPEMGESNAESALREERINEDFKHMKEERRKKRDKRSTRKHRAQESTAPNSPTNTKEKLTNNVQELPFRPTTVSTPTKTKACKTSPFSLSMILMLRYL
jgi:hypothetical protein